MKNPIKKLIPSKEFCKIDLKDNEQLSQKCYEVRSFIYVFPIGLVFLLVGISLIIFSVNETISYFIIFLGLSILLTSLISFFIDKKKYNSLLGERK